MSEQTAIAKPDNSLRGLLKQDNVKDRFSEIMKDRAPAFITSIINVAESSDKMKEVTQKNPMSIIRAAAVAAALNLPIDKNLGFSWIVPYNKKNCPPEAQFQVGWKGFVQLALRTGQYRKINVLQVNVGDLKKWDAIKEDFDGEASLVGEGEAIGFLAYFSLLNGFEKTVYFPKTTLLDHGKRYSKTFSNGPWKTHENEMCAKTAIKLTLSRWGIMSTDMAKAQKADQSIVINDDLDSDSSFNYVDGTDQTEAQPVAKLPDPANAVDLTPLQKCNQARAKLFAKNGKEAIMAIESDLTCDVKDLSTEEINELRQKYEAAL